MTAAEVPDGHVCDSLCDPRDPDDHHTCAPTYEECSIRRPWCECMCHGFSNDEPGVLLMAGAHARQMPAWARPVYTPPAEATP